MILKEMWISNYRGITHRHIQFNQAGITLVVGPNEAGKSSIIEALDLLFDELDSSAKQRVRDTKPVGQDVATEITLRASTGPYDFTYTKRFHREKRTELEIHSPRVERLSGRDAHNRVKGILEETMDDCLWKALRVQQGSGIKQAALLSSSSLKNALDQAAGGSSNAEQESDLYSAVKAESELYYSETGVERGELKRVKSEYSDLQSQLRTAEAELDSIERDVLQYENLERSLKRLKEKHSQEQNTLQSVNQDLIEIESTEEQLRDLKGKRELAGEKMKNVQLQVETRQDKARAIEKVQGELTSVNNEIEKIQTSLTDLHTSLNETSNTANQLRNERDGLQSETQLCDIAVEYLRDISSFNQVNRRLEQFTKAQTELTRSQDTIETVKVTERVLSEIQSKHESLIRAKAALDVKAPQVRVTAAHQSEIKIDDEVFELKDGQERRLKVAAPTNIELPGSIQIEVIPGTSLDESLRKLHQAQKELNELFSRFDVESLKDAEQKLEMRKNAESRKVEAESRMDEALDGETFDELQGQQIRLADRLERFKAVWPADRPIPEDLDLAQTALKESMDKLSNLNTALTMSEGEINKILANIDGQNNRLDDKQERQQVLVEQLTRETNALEEARKKIPDAVLEEVKQVAEKDLNHWSAQLVEMEQTLERMQPDLLRQRKTNISNVIDSIQEDMDGKNEELLRLRGRLDKVEADGTFEIVEDLRSKLVNKEIEFTNISARANAARHLYLLMKEARDEAFRSYRRPLRERISQLGRTIYGPSFDVELSEELMVHERILNNTPIPYEFLSAGAKEQLALLTRIAAADLVCQDEGVPIILDDALGFSDEHRLEWMNAILEQFGQSKQMVILTCNPERYRQIRRSQVVDFGEPEFIAAL